MPDTATDIIGRPLTEQESAVLDTYNALKNLAEGTARRIVKPNQDYRTRNMTWRAQEVLDLLDEYAARAGRRSR